MHITVDYFKGKKDVKMPTFIFLSHYHSDHLDGLEHKGVCNLIFCSAATKEVCCSEHRHRQTTDY